MTILITGATDGIGLALARHYHSQAKRLILIGRRPLAELDSTFFTPTNYCQADLSQPDCAAIVARFLQDQAISPLDWLIHNAGLGHYGPTHEQSAESVQTLMAVNLMAPMALTHALLPFMTASSAPKIVFISSVVSALPCPEYAVYGATKAALDGLARNLRIELRNSMTVQTIHPGATRTGMHAKSGMSRQVADWEKFPSAETIAQQIAQAIARGKATATIGSTNRLVRLAGYYFGGLVDTVQRRKYRNVVRDASCVKP